MVRSFEAKTSLVKIVADIIVQRETQKGILIGEKGSMIKKTGYIARKDIEDFLQQKVFLDIICKSKAEVEGE
jgi:GTP-binding protein Era